MAEAGAQAQIQVQQAQRKQDIFFALLAARLSASRTNVNVIQSPYTYCPRGTGSVSPGDAMKLHHAAALALVGWYLMVPPALEEHSNHRIYTKAAPLSAWQMISSFDTANECKQAIQDLVKPLWSAINKEQHLSLDEMRPIYAKCFASNDPRLAK